MGGINNLSMNNKTNEGVGNSSNQPSQMEELQNKINWEIDTLTDRVNVIENQINELKTIEVSDKVRKIVVGSTEFNIEDFMTKPDIEKYREWLKIKKELESKNEDELDDFVDETMMKDASTPTWSRSYSCSFVHTFVSPATAAAVADTVAASTSLASMSSMCTRSAVLQFGCCNGQS